MTVYKFTEKANSDLHEIVDYTKQQWGVLQTVKYIDDLEDLAQTLADNPDLGTERTDLSTDLLSFPNQSHIIYYKTDSWDYYHQSTA